MLAEARRRTRSVPRIAVRAVLAQVIRRTVEEAAVHPERHQDVLGHVHLVIVARQRLDGPSEKNDAGVRIAILRAGLGQHLGVREHGDQL